MKLVRKEVDKLVAVNIQVMFDKTKHLSDASIKRRKVVRDRLIEKDREKAEEEEKKLKLEREKKEKERLVDPLNIIPLITKLLFLDKKKKLESRFSKRSNVSGKNVESKSTFKR